MTNNPYQHPSAGPSYYPGSPAYGGHSPAPRPNFYPYPPHMAAHPSPQYQHPTPSRGRGHVNGSYGSRGSHHYHPYHPPPQASPYHHPSLNSPVNGPPLPQHPGQHIPYSPQSANKYNPSYSPSYHYPSPNAPVFTPSWQAQSPLSPLPKQLSMPPPQNVRAYYDSSRVPSAQPSPAPQSPAIRPSEQPLLDTSSAPSTPAPTMSEILPAEEVVVPEQTQTAAETVVEPSTQSSEPPPNPEVQETSVQLQSSLYSQTGTIQTSEIPGHIPATKPVAQWAIWSRRPQDPTHAPSIIISPRARPPPDVVQQALDLKTPPPSPPPSPPPAQSPGTPVGHVDSTLKLPSDEAPIVWSSQTDSTVSSSEATESEETPTFPGSPVSSHTSVSVVVTPVKDSTEVQPSVTEAAVPLTPSATALLVVNPVITTSSDTAVTPVETAEADTTKPLPVVVASTDAVSSPQLQQPVVADTSSTPLAPKKSWASLLRDPSSSSSLPTSSVIGFSIPGTGQAPPVPVPLSRKSELLNLLTTFPAPPTTGFAGSTSIRPRGLVNNGNMCFANSVLQVLVYCPLFHRLFVELGRLLSSDGVNKDSLNNTNKIPTNGSTLINATASFLQEFLDVSEKRNGADSISRTGVNNSSGSGVKGSGKGKEKEFKDEKSVGDNWDESFLPTYVYDVMKTKKRFDTMRGGHQEDAEEFFGFYLDTLEEELLSIVHSINPPRQSKGGSTTSVEEKEAAPPEDDGWFEVGKRNRTLVTRTIKSAESPITRIFGGKLRSTLRASGQKDSVIVEDWRSLRLDIQRDKIHTIQEALSYISHPQPVQVTQATKPGIIVDAHQQVLIEALPPILVLHIKRFHYDTTVGGVVKVGKHVRYGPELEIPSDLLVPAARKTQLGRYKLFGALYHHGQSASGGHYTLDVLHPTRFSNSLSHAKPKEGWIRMDDELVSDVRPDDVFKTPEEDDTRCAYLLFYRRI